MSWNMRINSPDTKIWMPWCYFMKQSWFLKNSYLWAQMTTQWCSSHLFVEDGLHTAKPAPLTTVGVVCHTYWECFINLYHIDLQSLVSSFYKEHCSQMQPWAKTTKLRETPSIPCKIHNFRETIDDSQSWQNLRPKDTLQREQYATSKSSTSVSSHTAKKQRWR